MSSIGRRWTSKGRTEDRTEDDFYLIQRIIQEVSTRGCMREKEQATRRRKPYLYTCIFPLILIRATHIRHICRRVDGGVLQTATKWPCVDGGMWMAARGSAAREWARVDGGVLMAACG